MYWNPPPLWYLCAVPIAIGLAGAIAWRLYGWLSDLLIEPTCPSCGTQAWFKETRELRRSWEEEGRLRSTRRVKEYAVTRHCAYCGHVAKVWTEQKRERIKT
jgi:endogenous inhibitor of DNA gyrase (YacG/DUF329 family)